VHIDRAKIYPVDPTTLEAVAGFEPIPVGDWAWGVSSDNGSWLAMTVGRDDWNSTELQLIDVDNWVVADTWSPSIDYPIHIGDNGTIYVINGSSTPHFSQMLPGEVTPAVIADLPDHFSWTDVHIEGQRATIFGFISPNDDEQGSAALVTVDLVTGKATEIPLPDVQIGSIGYLELPQNGDTPFYASPVVVWDEERPRVLIINTKQDVVTEVGTSTGEVIEHVFGTNVLDWTPTVDHPFTNGLRSAALGRPNGRLLYVASGVQTFELVDEYLTTRFEPLGIEVIDTETWEVIDRLDAPITDLSLSSDGNRLLATGQTYDDNPESQISQSSGFYVIDALDLEVIAHHEAEEPDRHYGGFSMNPGMPLGYVQSWERATNIDVVNLENGAIVASRNGGEIQFFAEAGVLVDTSFGSS
jgi:hypothetical protein